MNLNGEAGFFRHLLQFFGSLKLAMMLLATLILGCIIGTLTESRFDTAVAQAYIYDAPWFIAWLGLLCVNLTAVIFTRYPWKKRHIGFIMAHIGIITVLIGSIIGRLWGVEGNMTLFKGQQPVAYLTLPQKLLEVHTGDPTKGMAVAIRTEARRPTEKRPIAMEVDGVQVAALDYADELGVRTVVEEAEGGSPAVLLSMQSAMLGRETENWLALDDPERGMINLGPAVIRVARDTQGGVQKAKAEKKENCREVRFEFARMPGMGVARPMVGPATGVATSYRFDPGSKGKGVLEVTTGGRKVDIPVDKALGKTTPVKGTPWKVRIVEYFADFRMEQKLPVSVSDVPNNPALMFEVTGPASAALNEAASASGNGAVPPGHPAISGHSGEASPPSGVNTMTVFVAADQKLRFEAISKSKGKTSGAIEAGKEFMPQWADWRFQVKKVVNSAVFRDEMAPLSAEATRPSGFSGLKVRLQHGGETIEKWLTLGTPAHFQVGGKNLHVAFGHRIHPLPFGAVLEDFEVERDEGTQNPAGFKSQVRFIDPEDKVVMQKEIWMNNPANFPDFPGAGLLGTSYKFSQASWNPNDLNQTTLQVLRDPGWSLKWIGSLLLVGGIFTMFYVRPFLEKSEKQS